VKKLGKTRGGSIVLRSCVDGIAESVIVRCSLIFDNAKLLSGVSWYTPTTNPTAIIARKENS
jgi:hypothetical protein